ncbi:MAG: Dabb family protein [Candidatus Acidiferrales bacterium]
MTSKLRIAIAALAVNTVFAGGYLSGQGKNQFGTPSTIIHVSLIQWNDGVSDAEKQKALEGVKEMAAQIPGIKNVWIKATRMQPRDYDDAFVIEFADRAAADRYAKDPVHDAWAKHFLSIRASSISPQISN